MTKYVFLLGAGASLEAGMPTAVTLTKKVMDSLSKDRDTLRLLQYVQHGLLSQESKRGTPIEEIDIERLLNAVNILARRGEMDLDSFITSWDSKIDELDYPRGYMPDNAAQSFIESTKPSVETEAGLDLKSRSGRFAEATRKAIHTLKSTLYTDNAKVVSYLAPLTNIIRKTPVTIATLNYDNVLETFLDSHKINYEIGVEDWEDKFELTFPDPGVLLLKLHGSLNWDYELVTSVQDIPFQKFRVRDWAQVSETKNPAIIFGQRDKLTTEGPFLDLLRTFRDELFRCNHLVVVGYSFRDEHINTYIRYWFAKRHNRQLTIIDPSLRTTALPPEIRSQITETYLEPADESDREAGHIDVVEITHDVNHIKKGAGEGLAEFVSQETNTT